MSYSRSSCFSIPGSNALRVVNMSPIDRVHSEKLTVSIIPIQYSIYLQYVTVDVGASSMLIRFHHWTSFLLVYPGTYSLCHQNRG